MQPETYFPVHIPYAAPGQTIGQEYNRIMRDAPAAADWVLFLDHDVLLLHPHWYRVCLDAIAKEPAAGLFTCYTNNIGCRRQKDLCAPTGHDIAVHRAYARKRWDKYGCALTENKTNLIAGFFMLINKAAWKKAGGFLERGFFGVDNDFHRRLMNIRRKVYHIEGLYCYHVRDREQTAWIEGEKTSRDLAAKRTLAEVQNSLAPIGRMALYTVLTGGYDATPPAPKAPPGWDKIMFTDNPSIDAPGWQIRTFDMRGLSNVRASRIPKILPHEFLADYEYSIYIDARIRVASDINLFLTSFGWPDFGATIHKYRQCVYEEAAACIKLGKDSADAVRAQAARYRAAGLPKKHGLTANGVLARRHNSDFAKRIAGLWWEEYSRAESHRDQLALPFVLWKNGLTLQCWSAVDRRIFFRVLKHKPKAPAPATQAPAKQEVRRSVEPLAMRAEMRKALYTVVTGGYDAIRPAPDAPGFDCIAFTDDPNISAPGWEVRTFDLRGLDAQRAARLPKILPHKYLADYDYSLYIAGNFAFTGDPNTLLRESCWPAFAATRHPHRQCVYAELDQIMNQDKASAENAKAEAARYRAEGVPENLGLCESGLLMRRHNDPRVQAIAEAWWAEYAKGETARDQPSLAVALWRASERIDYIAHPQRDRFVRISEHGAPADGSRADGMDLTIVMPFYNEHELLARQIASWSDWPAPQPRVLVVDDASCKSPADALSALPPTCPQVNLFRIKRDIVWNQPGARNLGAKVAETDWILFCDVDHIFSRTAIRRLAAKPRDPGRFYTFARLRCQPHPCIILIRKDAFWKAGGFDEDFSGHYGHDDIEFRRRLTTKLSVRHLRDIVIKPVFAARPAALRDPEHNRKLLRTKRQARAMPVNHLRFEWERVL